MATGLTLREEKGYQLTIAETTLIASGVTQIVDEITASGGAGTIDIVISDDDPTDSLVLTATLGGSAGDIYWNAVVEWNEIQLVP